MKKVLSIICGIMFINTLFAQDALDSLFFRNGTVEAVVVTKSTKENIEFTYPNENMLNEVSKAELKYVKYRSGRIEKFNTIEDTLPIPEPKYIGDVYLVKDNNEYSVLDKESGELKKGTSFKANSFNALSLYIDGKAANLRVPEGTMKFIIRCVDNNSDPRSVITLYKFSSSAKKRSVILSRDNSDNMLNSKTYSKNKEKFSAERYGRDSYLVTVTMESGEYGFVVSNPNALDEKSLIISCIGIGKPDYTQFELKLISRESCQEILDDIKNNQIDSARSKFKEFEQGWNELGLKDSTTETYIKQIRQKLQ